jgi:(E)-4-hydroxy-3-methylbut-2-enyl-diphosphate synthase
VPIRIGVNSGSVEKDLLEKFGGATPEAMVESAFRHVKLLEDCGFYDTIISIKSSDVENMVKAYSLVAERCDYPLHLGVTEAGEGEDGRVKSAVGIGALLADGIGDTIRVSLSEAPEKELPVAKALVDYFANEQQSIRYAPTTQVKVEGSTVYYSNEDTDWATFQLHAAAECGLLLWDYDCIELKLNNEHFAADDLIRLSKDILQAARVRMYKTEYISCPGCGRTLFDLEQTIAEVKAATAHLQGLKIGIMGCIVNGPGEMADADYGYVGAGRGKVSLYKGKECVLKNIPQEQAVEQLLELIKKESV